MSKDTVVNSQQKVLEIKSLVKSEPLTAFKNIQALLPPQGESDMRDPGRLKTLNQLLPTVNSLLSDPNMAEKVPEISTWLHGMTVELFCAGESAYDNTKLLDTAKKLFKTFEKIKEPSAQATAVVDASIIISCPAVVNDRAELVDSTKNLIDKYLKPSSKDPASPALFLNNLADHLQADQTTKIISPERQSIISLGIAVLTPVRIAESIPKASQESLKAGIDFINSIPLCPHISHEVYLGSPLKNSVSALSQMAKLSSDIVVHDAIIDSLRFPISSSHEAELRATFIHGELNHSIPDYALKAMHENFSWPASPDRSNIAEELLKKFQSTPDREREWTNIQPQNSLPELLLQLPPSSASSETNKTRRNEQILSIFNNILEPISKKSGEPLKTESAYLALMYIIQYGREYVSPSDAVGRLPNRHFQSP